jgi:aspartyl-tRNA(Asn)/glutamyl-tRNA(Gln) amidotransferase subunit A
MNYYQHKMENVGENKIACDDLFLTKNAPTTAGSKMLDGYMSLFNSKALDLLLEKGYSLAGKISVGEFGIDLLGETNFKGALLEEGTLISPAAKALKNGEIKALLSMDINGYPRRSAAQNGLVSIKPTYGTVSRYGTVAVACSGECVSVMANSAKDCREVLSAIQVHDDKDGTSLPQIEIEKTKENLPIRKVAVLADFCEEGSKPQIDAYCEFLKSQGIETERIESKEIALSGAAWNILMSAEACNNVSRFDGVKYGYRTQNFTSIDELYTNSRTEAFGDLIKYTILFGSECLSTENYMKVYDKALRTRRVIVEAFASIFESFDAILLPAVSSMRYSEEQIRQNPTLCFEENKFTSPSSIAGLPALVSGGVQIIGKAFSEFSLLDLASKYEEVAK